ncbi:hypothetical protein GmHk_04G010824 [Glycine max]|nr:hypothetical protein GmHk_04G010824 [Glycine max]
MEAMKEQMATMMEAMMIMKKIMEASAVAVAATSTVAKVNLMPPSGLDQMNHPTSAMVGKDLGSTSSPHYVQSQNKHAFPLYGLPPNYTPPNVAYTPSENVNNSTPILIESRQPQNDHAHVSQPMGETHEMPHHNLADFEPCLRYATEGQAIDGIPLQNPLEGPQYHPQLHFLHSTTSKNPHAMAEMGKETSLSTAIPLELEVIPQVKELLDEGLVRKSLNPRALLVPKIELFLSTKFRALLSLSLHSSPSSSKLLSMASYGGELLLDSSSP